MRLNPPAHVCFAAALCVWGFALIEPAALAQQPPSSFLYQGSLDCRRCHDAAKPADRESLDFCRMNEARVWFENDKHSTAFRLMVGVQKKEAEETASIDRQALGWRMLQRLGGISKAQEAELDAAEKEGEDRFLRTAAETFASTEIGRGCLACHANLPLNPTFPNERVLKSFISASVPHGVSCEACHGPAESWGDAHHKFPLPDKPTSDPLLLAKGWRGLTPQEKFERFGMIDLRRPETRSEQCTSCHIGDRKQGKFIPHDWYAAGHPPLPSFEAETFAEEMPRHWRYVSEKGDFAQREAFLAANFPEAAAHGEAGFAYPQTRAIAAGTFTSLRRTVVLMAESHAAAGDALPDFAAFDCTGCHQELRSPPIAGPDRFGPARVGRPNVPRWPFALAEAAVSDEDRPAYEAAVLEFRRALAARPFGDRRAVIESAGRLTELIRKLELVQSQRPLAENEVSDMLARILSEAERGDHDFHGARQLAWGARTIAIERAAPAPKLSNVRGADTSREFAAWYENRGGARAEAYRKLEQAFRETEVSRTREPALPFAKFIAVKLPSKADVPITRSLGETLERLDRYEPLKFGPALRSAIGETGK